MLITAGLPPAVAAELSRSTTLFADRDALPFGVIDHRSEVGWDRSLHIESKLTKLFFDLGDLDPTIVAFSDQWLVQFGPAC